MSTSEQHNTERVPLPRGFRAAGMHCGIKESGSDLGLLSSEAEAVIAGTFTTNQVQAAPVRLCRERLSLGRARAIVVNSGNANACTGPQGLEDARTMGQFAASALGVEEEQVFVCSTGHIGVPLPMANLQKGIPEVAAALSADGAGTFARAIMTTDTFPKVASVQLAIGDATVTLTGMAKGSGMIEPKMATMLAFVVCDAAVQPEALQKALKEAVDVSFNRITVDGDRSTNDTVLLMANGLAGNEPLHPGHAGWESFTTALNKLTLKLALDIVGDGEGATRVVTVDVRGAVTSAEAEEAARSIANSSLIKTSWAGGQANWGRLMDALGYSRAKVIEDQVEIDYDGVPAVQAGTSAGTPPSELDAVAVRKAFTIEVRLNQGDGEAVMYSCDTTEEYVRINVEE